LLLYTVDKKSVTLYICIYIHIYIHVKYADINVIWFFNQEKIFKLPRRGAGKYPQSYGSRNFI